MISPIHWTFPYIEEAGVFAPASKEEARDFDFNMQELETGSVGTWGCSVPSIERFGFGGLEVDDRQEFAALFDAFSGVISRCRRYN